MESGRELTSVTCEVTSLPDEIQDLVHKSVAMKAMAYCPYSNFRVGSALLTKDRHIFTGCNVENASYSLGVCAERCNIFKAVSEGYTEFKAIAIACDIKDYHLGPCGACRQVIYEFGKDMDIYLSRPDGTVIKSTARELLPHGFGPECLKYSKVNVENAE